MDPKQSQESNHTSEQKNVASATEAPPSYNEAMGNGPYNNRPTAPPLETKSTNPSANNVPAQNQYPPQGPPPVYTANDPRFSQWDDRATRILITNRLRMNDQFNQAKNQQERDILWNLILIDLINDGYNNFMLYNLIEYWQFQYYIYQSIANGLSSNASNDWPFFEPMHNVFGNSSSGSGFTTDVLSSDTSIFPSSGHNILPNSSINSGPSILPSSTSTSHGMSYLPTPVIAPTPIIHHTPLMGPNPSSNPTVETPSTLPNQDSPNVTSSVQAVSSNVTSDLPSSSVQPITDSGTATSSVGDVMQNTAETGASESVPLLGQTGNGGVGNVDLETSSLLPNSSNDIQLSNIPATDAVSSSLITPSLGGHISSGDLLPSGDTTANVLSGIDTTSNNIGSDVITSQPTESFVPSLLNDDVISTQPTFSSPPLTTDDTTNADCCCGDDGCCCGDDDCCGGDDDCCGDGDCCAACDDCGGCDDCDFD